VARTIFLRARKRDGEKKKDHKGKAGSIVELTMRNAPHWKKKGRSSMASSKGHRSLGIRTWHSGKHQGEEALRNIKVALGAKNQEISEPVISDLQFRKVNRGERGPLSKGGQKKKNCYGGGPKPRKNFGGQTALRNL